MEGERANKKLVTQTNTFLHGCETEKSIGKRFFVGELQNKNETFGMSLTAFFTILGRTLKSATQVKLIRVKKPGS